MRWFPNLALAMIAAFLLTSGSASAVAETSHADPAYCASATFFDDRAIVSVTRPQVSSVSVWATQAGGSLSLVATVAAGGADSFSLVVPMAVSHANGGGVLVITSVDGRDIRDWLE